MTGVTLHLPDGWVRAIPLFRNKTAAPGPEGTAVPDGALLTLVLNQGWGRSALSSRLARRFP